jgi:hypothetical protein
VLPQSYPKMEQQLPPPLLRQVCPPYFKPQRASVETGFGTGLEEASMVTVQLP